MYENPTTYMTFSEGVQTIVVGLTGARFVMLDTNVECPVSSSRRVEVTVCGVKARTANMTATPIKIKGRTTLLRALKILYPKNAIRQISIVVPAPTPYS